MKTQKKTQKKIQMKIQMKIHIKDRLKAAGKESAKKDVLAYRRSCEAKGTGLSHYILMDRKTR